MLRLVFPDLRTNVCQQRKALEETNAMFPELKKKIRDALARLEQQLVCRLNLSIYYLFRVH